MALKEKVCKSAAVKAVLSGSCLLILLFFTACVPKQNPAVLKKMYAEIPAKNISNYRFDPSSGLITRVREAPEFLLNYLRKMDNNENYSPYILSAKETADLEKNIGILPAACLQTFKERLIGIYFINNLTGSGMSDFIMGNDNLIYVFLILNPETLRHNISEWITYRERTCFLSDNQKDKDIDISIDCGSTYTGLTYIILHEAGHIMDYVHNYTPYVEDAVRNPGLAVQETDFQKGFWAEYDKPAANADYHLRRKLSFYGLGKGPGINLYQAPLLYRDLEKSPFISLYGSLNWAEDLAEYFTWYYFTEILHQPYKIILTSNNKIILSFEPMRSETAKKRKNILAGILKLTGPR